MRDTRGGAGRPHHFQLLVAGTEPLPLAGDDGEQRVHLTLRELSGSPGTRTCGNADRVRGPVSSSVVNMHTFKGSLMTTASLRQ